MTCGKCINLAKIRSGARTYYKCELLNQFVNLENTNSCLKECPLKERKK